jgi:dipeptidyl aminopeptidase/acylaminoacyl peptidase
VSRWLLPGLVLLIAACGDGGTSPSGPRILIAGRLERSAPLRLNLVDTTDTIPPTDITWQVTPGSAGTFASDSLGATVFTPSVAARVTLIAVARGVQTSRSLTVPPPPSIVFVLLRNGNRDIWRVALDGGDSVRLTTDPADDRQPTASSTRVIFLSHRAAGDGFYSVSPHGGATVPLLLSATELGDPALNRDGSRLAFTSSVTGVPKTWVAAGDGTGSRRLAPGFGFDGAIEGGPAWSPDGKHLALMSTDPGAASLFVIDSSGASPVPVIDTLTAFQPSWSPTGDSIAFVAAPAGQHAAVYVVLAAGGTPAALTSPTVGDDANPVWLPDGRIVYVATIVGGAEFRWLEPSAPAAWRRVPLPPGEPSSPAYMPPS